MSNSIVEDYLEKGIVPSLSDLCYTDEAGLKTHSYEITLVAENSMRENMYREGCEEEYGDPHFFLEEIGLGQFLEIHHPKKVENTILNYTPLVKRTWVEVHKRLVLLKKLTSVGNVLVAGGAVFSTLFQAKSSDIDLFLYGCTQEEAEKKVHKICSLVSSEYTRVMRTKNAVTFSSTNFYVDNSSMEVQIILRLYKTKSEILHGFDVDSCCLGYDGKKVWATRRALFSLQKGYNTVSLDRLSPTYEYRLVKYAAKGVSVLVPKFNRYKVFVDVLDKYYQKHKVTPGLFHYNHKHLAKLKGLNLLLFFEKRSKEAANGARIDATIEILNKEHSDYSPTPYTKFSRGRLGTEVRTVLTYLNDSVEDYPEESSKYYPILKDWIEFAQTEESSLEMNLPHYKACAVLEFYTNNFVCSNAMFFVRGTVEHIEQILHFPRELYDGFSVVRKIDFPCDLEWKTTKPGEQMTNTFHKIVLENKANWYNGKFYRY